MKRIFLALCILISFGANAQPGKPTVIPKEKLDSLTITGKYVYDTIKVRIYYDEHDANAGWRAYKDGYSITKHLVGIGTLWNLPERICDKIYVPFKRDFENPEVIRYNWK